MGERIADMELSISDLGCEISERVKEENDGTFSDPHFNSHPLALSSSFLKHVDRFHHVMQVRNDDTDYVRRTKPEVCSFPSHP